MDRNPRCEAREEQSGETNHDCKCAPERLPRHDIAIANCEAGDEGEIERIADRPALDKTKQHARGNLNRQNGGQDRPSDMKAWPSAMRKRRRTVLGDGRFMRALVSSVSAPTAGDSNRRSGLATTAFRPVTGRTVMTKTILAKKARFDC